MTTKFRARPTTYCGVQMRSRLEASFAAGLDKLGVQWEYEPQCFADETGQYLPDFRLTFQGSEGPWTCYVEVKPTASERSVQQQFDRMLPIRSSEPEAPFVLASPELISTVVIDLGLHGTGLGAWHRFADGSAVLIPSFGGIDRSLLFTRDLYLGALAQFDWGESRVR